MDRTSRNPDNQASITPMSPESLARYERIRREQDGSFTGGFSTKADPWSWTTARADDPWYTQGAPRGIWPPVPKSQP